MTDLNANKDLVRAFIAAWNDRDFNRFDDLMGDGAMLHVGGTAVSCDPAGARAIAEEWTTAFPDWRFDLLRLVAEDDRVAAHMPYSGTFTKPHPRRRAHRPVRPGRGDGHLPHRRRKGRRSVEGLRRVRNVEAARRATTRLRPSRCRHHDAPIEQSRIPAAWPSQAGGGLRS